MSDEEILQLILENPYCQYFIGLAKFTTTMPFEVSSLSRVRERLGDKTFEEFAQTLIATLVEKKLTLKLTKTRTFGNGNVLLCYEPMNKKGEPHEFLWQTPV